LREHKSACARIYPRGTSALRDKWEATSHGSILPAVIAGRDGGHHGVDGRRGWCGGVLLHYLLGFWQRSHRLPAFVARLQLQSSHDRIDKTVCCGPPERAWIPNILGNCVNTIITADNLRPFLRLPRPRASKAYDSAARVLGSAWFLILALFLVQKVIAQAASMSTADFGPNGWPKLLATACLLLFYLAIWWFTLTRPSAAARSDGILPSLVAFAGTYLPWTIVLFAPGEASAGRSLASAALLLIGTSLMVLVIGHLGRSFSIVPQARTLVRTGPYAIVRNPLYLAEEVAIVGTLLQFYSVAALVLCIAHCGLQVGRILYEEKLLRCSFPDYAEYERSTRRLIPFVW
jgi:protein-S-isoprenylcysteine O-methyltransferase Ste14